uniref:GDSL esterase/lipase n=1 Tax=Oryza punctata TaxID=4537 RepID=A0A0E0JQL0_ORYPU
MALKPTLAALLFSLSAIHGIVVAVDARPAAAVQRGGSARDIPAVFAFGDSTLDAGNNNRLVTAVRADHPPYGQDFPGGAPTGRFSDGKIMSDFLVEALGIKGLLPAYHSGSGADEVLSDADAATGVSFASGGSGLDDRTATNAGVATLASQIADFSEFVGRMGGDKAGEVVNKSLFLVSAGTNDMIMNYYLLPSKYTLDQYHALLIGKLRSYILSLYNLGARRILVAGLPPVGCLPVQMTLAALRQPPRPQGCIAEQNAEAEKYNVKLRKMLTKFQSTSPGAKAVYADIYTPLTDMVDHPKKYGFAETGKGCCGTGLLEMGPLCTDLMPTCTTPAQFMFWDSVHPTQATYKAVADHFLRTNMLQFDD